MSWRIDAMATVIAEPESSSLLGRIEEAVLWLDEFL